MALLLLLPVGAASAVGCGSEDVSLDTVASAANATAEAGGARVSIRGSMEGSGLPGQTQFKGHGVQTLARKVSESRGRFDFTFTVPGAGQDSFTMQAIMSGLTMYIRSPLLTKRLPDDKRWMKIDLAAATERTGFDLGQLTQVGGNDPTQSLRYLRAVSGEVERVGTERVRGVETTHYKATIDLRRYPNLIPPAQRRSARAATEQLIRVSGSSEFPTEVWIDRKNLVRRQSFTSSMRAPAGDRLEMTQIIELYDFGRSVRVEVPAEDESYDVTKMAARQLKRQTRR